MSAKWPSDRQARNMANAFVARFPVAGSKYERLISAIEANLAEADSSVVWLALMEMGKNNRSAMVTPASLQFTIHDMRPDAPPDPVQVLAFDWEADKVYAVPPNEEWRRMREVRRAS